MRAKDAMICWNPKWSRAKTHQNLPVEFGAVKVGPYPDNDGWSRGFVMSGGACFTDVRKMTHDRVMAQLFIEAIHLIIRDRIDPADVHREFCKINEYLDGLADDMPRPSTCSLGRRP